ncbi:MAG: hypothetical protein UT30_C0003G0035 [Candidatus Uhrbacteria bacterium GW2011_GWF2_39_13]|uniref:DUF4012 domain-containing protein n=1 Tax=Candidatus Uhrbacteria bacterium GW2011_GWF2_39_13 TaxID=1618995 RepID=A0A0G0MWN4_9BACT|nr:MAG: hypothetical protein UT30_C0003G0035 [Candidatus Uhrbacteria bacterium GW2011_GWF2_39_13]HAU66276.1 hypothetical protein [Candidatus Uhrbacteria bacterium]
MSHTTNFLHSIETDTIKQKKRRTRLVRIIFLFFFFAILFWIMSLLVACAFVAVQILDAKEDMLKAKAFAQELVFEDAQTSLQEAVDSFDSARGGLMVIDSVKWVPVVGHSIELFADSIDSSRLFIEALVPLFELGTDLMRLAGLSKEELAQIQEGITPEITFDDLSSETKQAILARLSASAEDLDLLLARMDIVNEEIVLLSQNVQIEPFLVFLDPIKKQMDQMRESLGILSIGARLLPDFAGLDQPTTLLLLFLNNTELRPAGGFIGSYGVLETFAGDITQLETADTYTLDDAAASEIVRIPPVPLQTYNATTKWFFRDANWSPDFAVSSQQAISLFLEEVGFIKDLTDIPSAALFHGVIGVTPTYLSDLLAITGPITVGSQTFTSENIIDTLEYQVEFGYQLQGIPVHQRKALLADLVNELKTRLYQLPSKRWEEVLAITQKAFKEKQLLLYSANPQTQEILVNVGWAGSVSSSTSDTLMVVDANLASLKSDPAVERSTQYEVFKNASDQWIGRISIAYNHKGTFDWKTTRYRTYTRVYLPLGSKLIRSSGSWLNDKTQNPTKTIGSVDQMDELGFTSFGVFTSVEPGEQNNLVFEFQLSPQVIEQIETGQYDLTVLKQAGSQNNALTIDLDFDKNVTHARPSEDAQEWGDDIYRLNTILDHDLEIYISL